MLSAIRTQMEKTSKENPALLEKGSIAKVRGMTPQCTRACVHVYARIHLLHHVIKGRTGHLKTTGGSGFAEAFCSMLFCVKYRLWNALCFLPGKVTKHQYVMYRK